MSYEDDEEEAAIANAVKSEEGKKKKLKDCILDKPLKDLVDLICSNDMFKQQMAEMKVRNKCL
jgi:hypothetical protein